MRNIGISEAVFERNTFKKRVTGIRDNKLEFEIGDSKEDQFIPQAKVMRWDNEVNFSVRRSKQWKNPQLVEEDGKVKYKDDDEEVHFYERPDLRDGGLEIELLLKEKPNKNVFDFSIETKGLNFFRQEQLSQEDIDKGKKRPENVVGSYAVYHESKKHHKLGDKNYGCGKAFHIYRPHVVDAEGNEIRGEIDINTNSKKLSVTVPQDFLDNAVYPVLVDPTIGYTTAGASTFFIGYTDGGYSFMFRVGKPYAGGDGYIQKVTADLDTSGSSWDGKVFVNEVDSVASGSHGQVATASFSDNISGWYDINLGGEQMYSTSDYIISFLFDPTPFGSFIGALHSYDSGTASDTYDHYIDSGISTEFASPESPWTSASLTSDTEYYSHYITYSKIEFDAKSTNDGAVSTYTHSHVCSANASLLVVTVVKRATGDVVSGVTYNGVAMTRAGYISHSGGSVVLSAYIYYLVNPASGANNVVVSCTDSSNGRVIASSYEGTETTDVLDLFDSSEGDGTTVSTTVTPSNDNSLIVDAFIHEDRNAYTIGSGQTQLYSTDEGQRVTGSSYVIQGVAGSETMDWTGGSDHRAHVVAVFKIAGLSGGGGDIAKVNGIAIADIAKINGITKANISKFNGIANS